MPVEFNERGVQRLNAGPLATEPPMSPAGHASLLLAGAVHGGVIVDAEHARSLAELLLHRHWGKAELERQRPLIVEDKGDCWRVEGSWNRERKIDPAEPLGVVKGPFYVTFWKYDGRVIDFGVPGLYEPDPKAVKLIEEDLRRQRDERKA
jgi:hypothetical protein